MERSANNDNWAVHVSPSLETTHDILPSSSSLVKNSPSPFGMRICTLQNDNSDNASSQRLFYVSEQAALDRDYESHEMNGVGVRPGWYMIGEQGRFYVQIAVVKETDFLKSWEDGVGISLKVDGQDTNSTRLFTTAGNGLRKGTCSRFNGFVKTKHTPCGTRVGELSIDLFSFETISDALENKQYWHTETGTIAMHAQAGKLVKVKDFTRWHMERFDYPKLEVSAKEVAREGRSVRAGCSGLMKTETRSYSECGMIARRNLVAEGLTVYVRSRSWLRSRRIVDDDDQPFKHVDFIRERNDYSVSKRVETVKVLCDIGNGVERLRKRRHDVKKEKGLVDGGCHEKSVEVIDLTS